MGRSVRRCACVAVMVGTVLFGRPSGAGAQSVGIGGRVSFVRGDLSTSTPSTRYLGGLIRISASRRVVLEAALDTRTTTSPDGTARLREQPKQVSLLLYPVRSTISPYIVAGYGIYSQAYDTLSASGTVLTTTTTSTNGWHAGFGADLTFKKHLAFFADYRWRNIGVGTGSSTSIIPSFSSLSVSHQGSMWTGGMVLYF